MKKTQLPKYLFSLLLFGTNGIVASFIDMSSAEIVLMRTFIGSLFLLAVLFAGKTKLTFYKNKMQALYLSISGVALGASWMFLYEAYNLIGVGVASLLYYCGPVIVMIAAPILFKEQLTTAKIAGFAAVILGLVCINGGASDSVSFTGVVFGLMSALMYSVMVIFNKKANDISGVESSAIQIFVSFLTVAVFVLSKQGSFPVIEASNILPIIILGVINTGIGCYFYFSSLGQLPVQTASVCGYLEPLSAVVFSAAILGETMQYAQIFGAVLIICGAACSELIKPKRRPVTR